MDFFQLNLKNTLKIKQYLTGIGKPLIVPFLRHLIFLNSKT